MKKLLFLFLAFLFAISTYFVFYHHQKLLKYIPAETDLLILVDVKKMKRQSIITLATHPADWCKNSEVNGIVSFLNDSGLEAPDYLQIFHMKNQPLSDWNMILDISDKEKLQKFLTSKKFLSKGNKVFQKDNFFFQLNGRHCFVGTSIAAVNKIASEFASQKVRKNLDAGKFIADNSASITFLQDEKEISFAIQIKENEVEISNMQETQIFNPLISKLKKESLLLNLNLDADNAKNFANFFNFSSFESLQILDFNAVVDLESVNDTIITYGYDDNFNEIEKKSLQKITQVNYHISAQSLNPSKSWEFLKQRKWINSENQMTAIPFQPNLVSQNGNNFTVKSLQKDVLIKKISNENFLYFKNSDLLTSLLISLSPLQKKVITTVETVFYGNRGSDYLLKIKFKKGAMPVILE